MNMFTACYTISSRLHSKSRACREHCLRFMPRPRCMSEAIGCRDRKQKTCHRVSALERATVTAGTCCLKRNNVVFWCRFSAKRSDEGESTCEIQRFLRAEHFGSSSRPICRMSCHVRHLSRCRLCRPRCQLRRVRNSESGEELKAAKHKRVDIIFTLKCAKTFKMK